jgi:DNA-binding NtrC family response regulator
MKKDVNELKKMVFDMVQHPGMVQHVPIYNPETLSGSSPQELAGLNGSQAVIIRNDQPNSGIQHHEDVEESLSIIDKEKELIIKALKKHRGRRRDAAIDLGISERTLYRKLKEYDIEHL